MTFERNDGQAPSQYSYMSRHQGVAALFSSGGTDFVVAPGARLQMRFLSADTIPTIDGEHLLTGRANYLRGPQAKTWITAIPTYGQLRYANLYPGTDLLFHPDTTGTELEHDFILGPGADPKAIRFEMQGADAVSLQPDGQLLITGGGKSLLFHQPVAYQDSPAGRVPVAAHFRVDAHHVISFHLAGYDHSRPLIIDPVLSFSTYLDGSNLDRLNALTTDASGNIYAAGVTSSTDFPVSNAEQAASSGLSDAFISKLDPTGHTLIYSTYLGGSSSDEAESIAVDANGNVVVSGTSESHDFPHAGQLNNTVTGNIETFVASLNAAGNTLRYAGFLAAADSTSLDNYSRLSRVALDLQGNAYVAGLTDDPNFAPSSGAYGGPVAAYPAHTLFLAKVQPDGSFGYKATILQSPPQPAGSSVPPPSIGNIAVDSTGAVVLAGSAGIDLPTTSGSLSPSFPNSQASPYATAGYVLKLNPAGSALVFSTYLPGTDNVSDFAFDAAGNLYLAGRTYETTLPTGTAALQKTLIPRGVFSSTDAGFVLKLSGDGTTAIGATYLQGTTPQGSGGTDIRGIAVDAAGNVSVAGATGAADLPLKLPLQSVISQTDSNDLYFAQLTADLSTLRFGTFLHPNDNNAVFAALAAQPSGHMLLAGSTTSAIFPTTVGSFQPTSPPSGNPQTFYPRIVLAAIDLSAAAPALCFDNTRADFGSVLVNAVGTVTVNVTNCGNAPLTLTGLTASDPTVSGTQNCNSIAPAGVCQVQLAYAPTISGNLDGLLTLSGNTPVSPQALHYVGAAGYPQVDVPPSITFSYLLVGQTGSINGVGLVNNGVGPFILTSATVTGDFQITQNTCTAPLPYHAVCGIYINFSPTAAGDRTGVLTLTDNLTPSVQTIQLIGNGITSAPGPTVTTVYAVPAGTSGIGAVAVYGSGFLPNSTVLWNGQPRTTHYSDYERVTADLLPADTQQVGEAQVAVTTPLPGGGTSASSTATIYGRLQNLQVVNEVFEPHSQLIYATIAKTSPDNANSVVAIDPVAMKVVSTILAGNSPDPIAVSDDGLLLYVGLDDIRSVTQISLPGGAQNFTQLMPDIDTGFPPAVMSYASALKVVPGQPHTWVAGLCKPSAVPCGVGVVVFDDATVRPVQPIPNITAVKLVFVNDPTVVYSTDLNTLPPYISAFKISANGVQLTATVEDVGGSLLQSDGSFIYDNTGKVIDPATLTTQFTYPQGNSIYPNSSGGFTLDTANQRLYFAGLAGFNLQTSFPGGLVLSAVGKVSKVTLGQIQFPEQVAAVSVERFGSNGIAIYQPNQWLFVRTGLTQTTGSTPSLAVAPAELSFGSQTQGTASAPQTVTVTNPTAAAVTIAAITAGGDYTQTNNCGTTLAASASCVIHITFMPSLLGDRTAQLAIAFNGPGTPQSVNLDGTGVVPAPVVSVSPASLSFAAQAQGTASAAQTIMLTNTGTAALSITGISITGDYTQTNPCGTSLAASASCAISVTFTPSATGDRTGQLQIADNAPGTPHTVSLDGSGTAAAVPITLAPQGSGASSATVAAGGTATYDLTLATTSYTGPVQLTCTGAPSPATCAINPAIPNVTAGKPVAFVVTVTTSSATSALLPGRERLQVLAAGLGLAALLLSPLLLSLSQHRSRFVALLLSACAITLALAGCGSGSPSIPPVTPPKTVPSGTYQLTITATAGNQTTTELLTLTVK